MRTRLVATALLAASLSLFTTSAARATLVQRMEVEDLARASDLVAVARVEAVTSGWDGRGSIRTRTRMRVERVLGGAGETLAGSVVDVTSFGGEVDGIAADFPGNPRFREGERVVVFLAPWERRPGERQVVGAFQGAFRLGLEPVTAMPIAVRRAAPGAALVGGDSVMGDGEGEGGGDLVLYLDELEARVRAVSAGRGAR